MHDVYRDVSSSRDTVCVPISVPVFRANVTIIPKRLTRFTTLDSLTLNFSIFYFVDVAYGLRHIFELLEYFCLCNEMNQGLISCKVRVEFAFSMRTKNCENHWARRFCTIDHH